MMIHIASEELTSGTIYNGVWTLSRKISGNYKVLYQQMDISDVPWISSNTNSISFQYSASPSVSFQLFLPGDIATYQVSTDLTAIANYIETRFNDVFTGLGFGIGVTVTIDTDNRRFVLTFTSNITLQWDTSSCHTIFKQSGSPHAMVHYMSYTNITISTHLFMKIQESVSTVVSTNGDIDCSLIFHTYDAPLTSQAVNFRIPTNTLTISFYRASFPTDPVPITGDWELVLAPLNI